MGPAVQDDFSRFRCEACKLRNTLEGTALMMEELVALDGGNSSALHFRKDTTADEVTEYKQAVMPVSRTIQSALGLMRRIGESENQEQAGYADFMQRTVPELTPERANQMTQKFVVALAVLDNTHFQEHPEKRTDLMPYSFRNCKESMEGIISFAHDPANRPYLESMEIDEAGRIRPTDGPRQ